jgi:Cft2 family RNA processing exonuclease
MSVFRFTNLTRNLEIGANSYLLEINGHNLVLDCGAHPKQEGLDAQPLLQSLKGRHIDAAILTHAHQDHLGSLPVLLRDHPETVVFSTEPTRELADVMLHNSVNVMTKRQEQGSGIPPSFNHREATSCIKRFFPLPLAQRFNIQGERLGANEETDLSIQLEDAGHILGSAAVLIEAEGKRILYTGDVNFHDQSLMRAARLPQENLDTIIIECTRGATPSPADYTDRTQEEHRFAAAIREIFAQGGSVLVPVFALGKSQELLVMLHTLRKKGLLPECPLYIGGLSTKLTEIHDKLADASVRQHDGMDLMETLAPFTISGRELDRLPIRPGRIYALSSGMMTEHTLSNIVARQFLPNPAHGIFFVGYADPESPAGRLRSTKLGEPFMTAPDAEPEKLRCRVETFAFSAHSDRDSIRDYLQKAAPKRIILVHGEPAALQWFKDALTPMLPSTEILFAEPGVTVEL